MPIPAEHRSARGSTAQDKSIAGATRAELQGTADQREIRLLQALSDAAREMHRSLSLGEVVRIATERARQIVGADEATTIMAMGSEWSTAQRAVASRHAGPLELLVDTTPMPGSPAGEVCRTNRPIRLTAVDWGRWRGGAPLAAIRETETEGGSPGAGHNGNGKHEGNGRSAQDTSGTTRDGRRVDTPRERRPGAWLGAPLVGSDGRNLGLIQLAGKTGGGPFSAGDEAVLLQLARMASVAMENARLYEAALETRAQLSWAAHIERVRAAELGAVINAMGEAVLVCDAAGIVNIVNPAAEAVFDGSPVGSYADLLSRFRIRTGEKVDPIAGPVELQLGADANRWIELRVYPVPAVGERGDDEGGGLIAVMRDVSAARQARGQREAFLGILSHELRTPITTIYAGSKVLARDEPLRGTSSRELAADISAEAERLFRLVEDLLVMTRIERGVLQLANEPVLLQRVVAAAIRMESAHWPTTRIRLAGSVDLPAVAGDATYVEQVIRNLLSNAAKYSPPEAEIEVRLEASGDEVSCRVLDRGRGFQSGEAEDLFDLFYRSPSTAAQAAGAGIGLFVCRRLVNAMDGRIWARPRPAGGAEFGFALRRYDDE